MNTIIIENNAVWRSTLETYVNQQASLKLIGSFTSILEAYYTFHTEKVDLIILNISIPSIESFDFSQGLNKAPLIIFSKNDCDRGIHTNNSLVVDVLTPPLVLEHFEKAVGKATRWAQIEQKEDCFFIT